jgi:hypothetical protein
MVVDGEGVLGSFVFVEVLFQQISIDGFCLLADFPFGFELFQEGYFDVDFIFVFFGVEVELFGVEAAGEDGDWVVNVANGEVHMDSLVLHEALVG